MLPINIYIYSLIVCKHTLIFCQEWTVTNCHCVRAVFALCKNSNNTDHTVQIVGKTLKNMIKNVLFAMYM